MSYLIQLLLRKLEMQHTHDRDYEKYEQVWSDYKERVNKRFTLYIILFVGIPFMGLSFILFLIDYPEPVNIPGPFGWWK